MNSPTDRTSKRRYSAIEVTPMRARIGLSIIAVLAVLLSVATARAELRGGSSIEDGAGFFSSAAIAAADRIIDEIRRDTRPSKGVTVVTVTKLGAGTGSPKELAERLFRERSIDGLLIFAVKDPGRLDVVVGRRTEARFNAADRDELVAVMLERFKKKEFDAGLLAGLRFGREKLVAAFPADGRPAAQGAPRAVASDQGGLPAWMWIVIIAGGAWLMISLARASRQRAGMDAPASGGYPPYSAGSGGFGRSLLGGLFGAMAGSWLYDQFSGRGESSAYDRRDDTFGGGDASDHGDVGGSSGGDFFDSSDSGGGDFGGGDSGGGDF
jgi:uncharacterized membrane protein YgcG